MCNSIGERILKLRKALNLTQGAFAGQLGISQQHISHIENGTKEASDLLVKHICLLFNTTETWMTTGEGEMFLLAEEIVKKQIFQLGEQAYYEALKKLLDDNGLVALGSIRSGARLNDDPDLDHMMKLLNDLWSVGDENLKAWAKVQFARAFPPDVEEEVQKKRAENHGRESIA